VYFTCSASKDDDSPYPLNIRWYNDRGIQLKLENETNISVLLIERVNDTNAGVYTCQAYDHPESIAERKINLSVKCMYKCNNSNTGMRACLICICICGICLNTQTLLADGIQIRQNLSVVANT